MTSHQPPHRVGILLPQNGGADDISEEDRLGGHGLLHVPWAQATNRRLDPEESFASDDVPGGAARSPDEHGNTLRSPRDSPERHTNERSSGRWRRRELRGWRPEPARPGVSFPGETSERGQFRRCTPSGQAEESRGTSLPARAPLPRNRLPIDATPR